MTHAVFICMLIQVLYDCAIFFFCFTRENCCMWYDALYDYPAMCIQTLDDDYHLSWLWAGVHTKRPHSEVVYAWIDTWRNRGISILILLRLEARHGGASRNTLAWKERQPTDGKSSNFELQADEKGLVSLVNVERHEHVVTQKGILWDCLITPTLRFLFWEKGQSTDFGWQTTVSLLWTGKLQRHNNVWYSADLSIKETPLRTRIMWTEENQLKFNMLSYPQKFHFLPCTVLWPNTNPIRPKFSFKLLLIR